MRRSVCTTRATFRAFQESVLQALRNSAPTTSMCSPEAQAQCATNSSATSFGAYINYTTPAKYRQTGHGSTNVGLSHGPINLRAFLGQNLVHFLMQAPVCSRKIPSRSLNVPSRTSCIQLEPPTAIAFACEELRNRCKFWRRMGVP